MSRKTKKPNRIFPLIALTVILVLGPTVYFGLLKPHKTVAAWFDDGWHYRKTDTI